LGDVFERHPMSTIRDHDLCNVRLATHRQSSFAVIWVSVNSNLSLSVTSGS
jgi:hypothetical protein